MASALKQLKMGMFFNAIFGYHVGVVALGLLLHPYKTVQEIIRSKLPGSSVLLPFGCWIIGFLVLRTMEHFLFALLPFLGLWWFLFIWGTVFLFFWQILLFYLFWRFARSLKTS